MTLIPSIKNRGFGVVSLPGSSHLVNPFTRCPRLGVSPGHYVLTGFQHFSGLMADLAIHRQFILVPRRGVDATVPQQLDLLTRISAPGSSEPTL